MVKNLPAMQETQVQFMLLKKRSHSENFQKDQSLRQLVSCEYQMNQDKSNRIKKKCWGRKKFENTNHNNNQHLYLEIFLFCTIVKKKNMLSSPPSHQGTRAILQSQECHTMWPSLKLHGIRRSSLDQTSSQWLAKNLFWNLIPNNKGYITVH